MAVDHLLLESGDRIEIEGGTTHLVLESSTTLDDDAGAAGVKPRIFNGDFFSNQT